jgi:phage tail-like protein
VLLGAAGEWELAATDGVEVDERGALQLALDTDCGWRVLDATRVDGFVMPRWLAFDGCDTWWECDDELRRLGPCDREFTAMVPPLAVGAPAVAALGGLVGVIDQRGSVVILDTALERIVDRVEVARRFGAKAVAVVLPDANELLVATADGLVVHLDRFHDVRAWWQLNAGDPITALGECDRDDTRSFVATTGTGDRWGQLWWLSESGSVEQPLARGEVAAIAPAGSGPVRIWSNGELAGFCLPGRGCFDRHGGANATLAGGEFAPRRATGWARFMPIDSRSETTRWSRILVEAQEPPNTSISAEVCASDTPEVDFDATNWLLIGDATDARLREVVGRYLHVRLTLAGDGSASPTVQLVRIDTDLPSGLDDLPAVYREDPAAADFLRRFLALFERVTENIDDAISASAVLFDPVAADDALLPFLVEALGVEPHPTWTSAQLRRLLACLPELLRTRGTPAAIVAGVHALYDVSVLVEEPGRDRPWGTVGTARFGEVRLHTRAGLAVTLGRSRLGAVRIDAFTDPATAARNSGSFLCRVTVAGVPALTGGERAGLVHFVRAWTPAHVEVEVRFASSDYIVGSRARLGNGSSLARPRLLVLGRSRERSSLDRRAVLGRRRSSGRRGTALGIRAHVGYTTTLE